MTCHFIPMPTHLAAPKLQKAREKLALAERTHIGRGPARKTLIHLTARHLAYEVAQQRRATKAQASTTPDLFGGGA